MIEMRVRNIDPETRRTIKQLAKNSKMSIAEYLGAIFNNLEPREPKNYQWHLTGVPPDVKVRIKKQAAQKNMGIGEYLDYLSKKEAPKKNELAGDIKEYLDKVYALIDDFS